MFAPRSGENSVWHVREIIWLRLKKTNSWRTEMKKVAIAVRYVLQKGFVTKKDKEKKKSEKCFEKLSLGDILCAVQEIGSTWQEGVRRNEKQNAFKSYTSQRQKVLKSAPSERARKDLLYIYFVLDHFTVWIDISGLHVNSKCRIFRRFFS